MSKVRLIFLSIMAAGILISLSANANAQMSQANVDQMAAKARQAGPCRDPWITVAFWDLTGSTRNPAGIGDLGECNTMLYGGSWSSYADLYRAVQTTLRSLSAAGASITASRSGNTMNIVTDAGGGFRSVQVVRIIGNDGASIISNDGASLVAWGAGNFSGMATTEGNTRRVKLGKSVLAVTKR
jgi:hypothetical protein